MDEERLLKACELVEKGKYSEAHTEFIQLQSIYTQRYHVVRFQLLDILLLRDIMRAAGL
jgi:hypothetical protein